jgi:hypothetical protein
MIATSDCGIVVTMARPIRSLATTTVKPQADSGVSFRILRIMSCALAISALGDGSPSEDLGAPDRGANIT